MVALELGNVNVLFAVVGPVNSVKPLPVPPFAEFKIPAKVIAPVVAVAGVNPVVPPENEETPEAASAHEATPAELIVNI